MFSLPNRKYEFVLNAEHYYILALVLIGIPLLLLFAWRNRMSFMKRRLILLAIAFLSFGMIGSYYIAQLPGYTYEDAVRLVEREAAAAGRSVEVIVPKTGSDRALTQGEQPWLQLVIGKYAIHVREGGTGQVYLFDPESGTYELFTKQREGWPLDLDEGA
ncbi:hypothetical protein M3650_07385 [Paenibacillus sp. MER TA 81-3]|uniref:hypothetical protein n=1 Tax=Paenibacillus sp. MER TA 81-3 TaxID=2939573 RepID=UPI00203E6C95|nr:hypothetical protein [Paenibacillus sp. MER TA 81-3]MCM3338456.1 hypothetical protein [Paenibacillus sp. MER TA 81-3]